MLIYFFYSCCDPAFSASQSVSVSWSFRNVANSDIRNACGGGGRTSSSENECGHELVNFN